MNSAYTKFNEIKKAYLSSLATIAKSQNTYKKYDMVLNDFGKWLEQNDCEETGITAVQILAYSKTVKERGSKNNTLRHYLIILRSFFTWCINHKFYTEQPVLEEDIPKQERIEYDLLSEEQIEKVLNSTPPKYSHAKTAKRNHALIALLIQSGLRVSELINLKVGDLEFGEKGTIKTVGKGDKLRYTTFPELSQQLIKEYLNKRFNGNSVDENAILFANDKGQPYTRQNITKIVNTYIKWLTGKTNIGAHDLRHSFASELITNGAQLEQIQQVLGHSSYATTVIYASHLAPKRISQDLNRLLG